MFGVFTDAAGGSSGPRPVDTLAVTEARLLWAVRRLALMRPIGAMRCHAVHIALQQDFGDAGMGIEHLLRCWLVGLARLSGRRLAFGEPGCPLLTADEAVLLGVLRQPAAGGAALVALTANAGAARLLPLFAAVAGLAAQKSATDLYKTA